MAHPRDRRLHLPGFLTRPWLKTSWEWEPELLNSVLSDWIDKTAPTTTLSAPAWASATAKVGWTAKDERFGSGAGAYRFAWKDQSMGDWVYGDWSGQTARTLPVPAAATTLDLAVSARDVAGNTGAWTYRTVNIDRVRPTTKASAAGVTAGRTVTLKFRVDDAAPTCGKAVVKIEIRRRKTLVKTILVGTRPTNTALTYRYTAKLRRGTYNWRVLATDIAGNVATSRVAAALAVR